MSRSRLGKRQPRAGEALPAWAGWAGGRGGEERAERGERQGGGTARGDVSVSFCIGHVRLPGKQSRNRWEEGSGWSVLEELSLHPFLPAAVLAGGFCGLSEALGAEILNRE